jgi:hypothetical protein
MRRIIRGIIFIFILVTVTFILLEIAVRLSNYSQMHFYDHIYEAYNKDISYKLKPNLLNAQGNGCAIINTDSLGLRSKTSGASYGSKKDNEYRIAITGDSITFGNGVKNTDDTFCAVLEDLLNRKKRPLSVKVFNFGVSAYSVKEMVGTLRHRMLKLEPDYAIMAIIPDDLNLCRTPTGLDRWGYWTSKTIFGNSHVKHFLRNFHLSFLLNDTIASWNYKNMSQLQMPDSYKFILQFKHIAEQHNLNYCVAILPDLSKLGFEEELLCSLKKDGVIYVNLQELSNQFNLNEYMASKFDSHPSAAVHKEIAKKLSKYINNFVTKK